MLKTIDKRKEMTTQSSSFWEDEIFQNYYKNHFNSLSSKQLDKEFSKDLNMLAKTLKKLPENERKTFIEILSKEIEFYIENKVEKELEFSINKILKF
ncbi:MAG: hypothetical protein Q8910_07825 [Bacteroidota bacterium]|nr:hypothetical protein [Bacteroidota bacterium]